METTKKEETCQELKNLKYKTMLMNGGQIKDEQTTATSDINKLDTFLQNDMNTNQKDLWTKLDKTMKMQKIIEYAQDYAENNKLDNTESKKISDFLKECINKKRIHRVKDISYDKDTGKIKDIPGLFYSKTTKKYTLKNTDKRVSTLKNLPQRNNSNMNLDDDLVKTSLEQP
jgi:hypothetical protein|tara:strand:+ start:78 stop:593 length:516 start_codon:yes stop_codon:yes gene_type:complete